jgi:hypothetical protein
MIKQGAKTHVEEVEVQKDAVFRKVRQSALEDFAQRVGLVACPCRGVEVEKLGVEHVDILGDEGSWICSAKQVLCGDAKAVHVVGGVVKHQRAFDVVNVVHG